MPQESNIRIEVSTDNKTFSQLALLPAGSTSYRHIGLPGSATRYYRGIAVGNGSTTADSAPVTAAATTAAVDTTPPTVIQAYVMASNKIGVDFSEIVTQPNPLDGTWSVKRTTDTGYTGLVILSGIGSGTNKFEFTLDAVIAPEDSLTISYGGTSVQDLAGNLLAPVTELIVNHFAFYYRAEFTNQDGATAATYKPEVGPIMTVHSGQAVVEAATGILRNSVLDFTGTFEVGTKNTRGRVRFSRFKEPATVDYVALYLTFTDLNNYVRVQLNALPNIPNVELYLVTAAGGPPVSTLVHTFQVNLDAPHYPIDIETRPNLNGGMDYQATYFGTATGWFTGTTNQPNTVMGVFLYEVNRIAIEYIRFDNVI